MRLMKHCLRLTFITLTLMLVLAGCRRNETVLKLNEFSSTVSFCGENAEYKGDFYFVSKDEMSLVIEAPDNIKNCRFTYLDGETTLAFERVTTKMTDNSPVKILFDIISDFSGKEIIINETVDSVIEEKTSDIEYTVTVSEGKIKEVKSGRYTFVFA